MRRKVRNRKKELRNRIILMCSLAVVILLAGTGISYAVLRGAVNKTGKDTIYDHIYIGAVNVSGMKKDEAKKAVENQVQEYQTQKIALHVEGEMVEVTLQELGFHVENVDKLVKEAVAYGKSGSVWSRYRKMKNLEHDKKELKAIYAIDQEKTAAVLGEKAQPLEKAAANASIVRKNGTFVITDEVEGQKIDVENSIREMETYFNKKWDRKTAQINLISVTDQPAITREQLEVIQDTLGTFTTYCGSGGGRVQNIVTGAGHINGSVIMPGEEFSADAAMRPYTYDNGYAEAGSYEAGKVVQTMGGGICQVSSTLYNTVLLAELEVTQRQPHSMLVDYVKPSRDAAIAGDVKDLKFRNNTKDPIYIEGYVSGGNITFTIYGKETRAKGREIEYISETLSTQSPEKKFEASGAELGTMQKGGSPHTGNSSQLWKVVRENGVEVSREIVNKSRYRMSPIVISVGTASNNAEASALVKAAISSQDEAKINAAIAQAKEIIKKAAEEALKPPAEQKPEEPEPEAPKPPAEQPPVQTPPATE